jgi:hypothetical protein
MTWKIIVTAIILLFIVLIFATSQPEVGRLFGNINLPSVGGGKVLFSGDFTGYQPVQFRTQKKINMTFYPVRLYAEVGNGNIVNTSDNVYIYGFSGSVYVENDYMQLNGSFERLVVADTAYFGGGKIDATTDFSFLTIEDIGMDRLVMNSTSGKFVVNNVGFQLSGDRVEIGQPAGRFEFEPANTDSMFRMDGTAQYINVPGAGISVR